MPPIRQRHVEGTQATQHSKTKVVKSPFWFQYGSGPNIYLNVDQDPE